MDTDDKNELHDHTLDQGFGTCKDFEGPIVNFMHEYGHFYDRLFSLYSESKTELSV